MALIAKYAMENDKFVEIVTTLVYTSDPTERHPNGILWTSINNMQKFSRTATSVASSPASIRVLTSKVSNAQS